MAIRVRVRIHLPPTELLAGLALSGAAHAAIVAAVLVAGTRLGLPRPAQPLMTVRLVAGAPEPAVSAPRRRPETKVAQRPPAPAPPKPEPRPKPKVRTRVDEPRVTEPPPKESATARPENLPARESESAAEPPPPAPDPSAASPSAGSGAEVAEGPIAGGVAGVATDQPFTADWYLQLVVARLQDAWRDRPLLPWGAAPQRVLVGFTILRDGRVTEVRVVRPSRYSPLDHSALRAVRSLGRLPPLPRGYDRDQLGARFVFELRPPAAR